MRCALTERSGRTATPGTRGVARPDHFARLTYGDFEDEYWMERLYAIGYMRGLIDGLQRIESSPRWD